jgi:hypothetical protein
MKIIPEKCEKMDISISTIPGWGGPLKVMKLAENCLNPKAPGKGELQREHIHSRLRQSISNFSKTMSR